MQSCQHYHYLHIYILLFFRCEAKLLEFYEQHLGLFQMVTLLRKFSQLLQLHRLVSFFTSFFSLITTKTPITILL